MSIEQKIKKARARIARLTSEKESSCAECGTDHPINEMLPLLRHNGKALFFCNS